MTSLKVIIIFRSHDRQLTQTNKHAHTQSCASGDLAQYFIVDKIDLDR